MQRSISSILVLGACLSSSLLVVACGSDESSSSSVIIGTGSSSSSSSGTGGSGGEGGAGQGGMGTGGMGTGGMGTGGMGTGGMGTGGMGTGGMGTGGGMAACQQPAETCASCLWTQCNMAWCDCANEPACLAIVPCAQGCPMGDKPCVDACFQKNSLGFSEFIITSSCASTLCAPSCNGEQVKPCDLCLAQQCEQQFESCIGNPACTGLIDCAGKCAQGDTVCQQACLAMYATGAAQAQQLNMCAKQSCSMCN